MTDPEVTSEWREMTWEECNDIFAALGVDSLPEPDDEA